MATALKFSQNIRKRASQVQNRSATLVKKVAKATLRELVLGTPVDKGVARSNWRVSIGNPTYAVIPAYAPGRHLGIKERDNADATISAGNMVIATLKASSVQRGKAANSLYISNNTPYIELLNNGSSTQSAGGFIEKASIAARREIKNFKVFSRTVDEED